MLIFSALLLLWGSRRRKKWARARSVVVRQIKNRPANQRMRFALLSAAFFGLIPLVMGSGISSIFYRTEYIQVDSLGLSIVGRSLAPLCVLICGYIFGLNGRVLIWRAISFLIFIAYVLVLFSYASRLFSLSLPLFFLGYYLVDRSKKLRALPLVTSIIVAPVLQAFPLAFRGLNEFGVFPFLAYLSDGQWLESFFVLSVVEQFFANLLFSVPLTTYILNSASRIDLHSFIVSISPLPSFMLDWYDIAPKLRVSAYIPYNAIGELLAQGPLIAVVGLVLLTAWLNWLDKLFDAGANKNNFMLTAAPIAMSITVAVVSVQYNLRSSCRLIYYSFLVAFFASFLRKAFFYRSLRR